MLTLSLWLVACSAPKDSAPPVDTMPTETEDSGDTAAPEVVVWQDLRLASSTSFNALYGTATDAWAAGTGGALWRVGLSGESESIDSEVDADLNALRGQGEGDGVALIAAGTSGIVAEVAPDAVSSTDLGTVNLYGLAGSEEDLTAVGWGGVYRRTGAEWELEESPPGLQLNAVWVDEGGDAVAVGNGGTIAERNKGVWSLAVSPTQDDIYAIAGASAEELWAVGEDGLVLRRQEGVWTEVDVETDQTLWGVWQAETGEVFLVGNGGTALRFGGTGLFAPVLTGVDSNLYAVHGSSASSVWAVGNRGQVLRYTP